MSFKFEKLSLRESLLKKIKITIAVKVIPTSIKLEINRKLRKNIKIPKSFHCEVRDSKIDVFLVFIIKSLPKVINDLP